MTAARAVAPAVAPLLRADAVARHAIRLVVVGRAGPPAIVPFATLPAQLGRGDLVVVNDAATLPASLRGHTSTGAAFELRLSAPIEIVPRPRAPIESPGFAGARSIAKRCGDETEIAAPVRVATLTGVAFGAGDHRTPTEHRAAPPPLAVGERVVLGGAGAGAGALAARVVAGGRRVVLHADVADDAAADALRQAVYAGGRPIQYAHRRELLPLHAVQTAYATRPWAVEMPSAGRGLTWDVLLGLRRAGIAVARLTHAAGLSSTGDVALDHALPWPERYDIPAGTATAITATRRRGGRVIAIGTTVVRALEASGGAAGPGVATLRLDARTRPRIVDGLVSGLHVPGESHFDLLSAFAPAPALRAAIELAADAGLSAHELGDACLVV